MPTHFSKPNPARDSASSRHLQVPQETEPPSRATEPTNWEDVMNRHHRWMLVILLIACLPLTSCKQASEAAADEETGPAKVEHLQGDQPTRVTLTKEAAARLDIKTAKITDMEINGT